MKHVYRILQLLALLFLLPVCTYAQSTIYVNVNNGSGGDGSSWANAFQDLQDGIDAASAGDQIWVAQGNYYPTKDTEGSSTPTLNQRKTFYISIDGVELYGGFSGDGTEDELSDRNVAANSTILDGDLSQNDAANLTGDAMVNDPSRADNAYHVVFVDGSVAGNISTATIIDGFIVQNGVANGPNAGSGNNIDGYGGGLINFGSGAMARANPTIRNCTFTKNATFSQGGGMANYGPFKEASPIITDCLFFGNHAIGSGGAMTNFGRGSNGSASPILERCQFFNNSAGRGGAVFFSGDTGGVNAEYFNCLFQANGDSHIGFDDGNDGSGPKFVNCTFEGANEFAVEIIFYDVDNTVIAFENCIFWNNTDILGGSNRNDPDGNIFNNITVANCIVGDDTGSNYVGSNGNLADDPLFVDAANGNLALKFCSPAVDVGNNAAISGSTTDIEGNTRIVNSDVDLGAYEFQGNIPSDIAIECPQDVTTNTDAQQCSAVVNDIELAVTDDCNASVQIAYDLTGATVASDVNDASGRAFEVGTTTVTYAVTDDNNRSNSCNFTVKVEDNEKPVANCPDEIRSDFCVPPGADGAPITINIPNPEDNCPGVSAVASPPSGNFSLGTTPVTITATDAAGNVGTCTFNVIVEQNPTIVIDNIILPSCPGATDGSFDVTVNDNCGGDYEVFVTGGPNTPSTPAISAGETVTFSGLSATATGTTYTITVALDQNGGCRFGEEAINCFVGPFATQLLMPAVLPISCPSAGPFCAADAALDLSTLDYSESPTGGSFAFSGDGVSETMFDPAAATIGANTVTVVYTAPNGCMTTCDFDITVNASPTLVCPSVGPLCIVDAALDLSTLSYSESIAGGSFAFSGDGVSGNLFDPASATLGTNTVTVVYTAPNGCTVTCDFDIVVNTNPTISCPSPAPLCAADAALDLSTLSYSESPAGGSFAFSGDGVSGNLFDPAAAMLGSNTIMVVYTAPNGCTATCDFDITVNASPAVPTIDRQDLTRCRRETATISVLAGTDLEFVWEVLEAPNGVSFAAGDRLEPNVDGSDYRTDLQSDGRELRTKGSARAGLYRFKVLARDVNTMCESELTADELSILINDLPAVPTADKMTAESCVPVDANDPKQVRATQTGNTDEVFVWTLTDAPDDSQFDGMEPLDFLENEVNTEFRITGGMQGDRVTLRQNADGNATNPADNVYGTWEFSVKVRNTVTGCEGDPLAGFTLTSLETPADPVAATATKVFCNGDVDMPSLANTGISVSNTLTADEKVVWVLTGKPDDSAYAIDDEFTTDNCGDAFKNFGELAVANSSKVIRVQDIANAPIGTYTFDAFITNCVTGCSSELVSGFSITVNETPAVPSVNRLTRASCVGSTSTVSVLDPGTGLEISWEVVAAPSGASFMAEDVLAAGVDGPDYRTDLDANGMRLRIKGAMSVAVGIYQFKAKVINPATSCESELTTEVFEINIFAQPTVDISADPDGDLCLGQLDVMYDATITSTDGGTYTFDWCAYNAGDGSGTCFDGFDDNTAQTPKRSWTSSAGSKSVGVTVMSDVQGCMATDLYSFEVVAPTMLACPANQTVTLITNPSSFDCLAEATFTNPEVVPGPCDPVNLTILVDGGTPETVTAGESYTAMFQELGVFTVTYDSEDAVGNTSTCSFDISVDGLPCGLVDNGGIGCNTSTSTFDQGMETFSLTSDCAPNTMLYTEDQTAFVFTELCGNGEITAQVTGLSGTGFAGVMMRAPIAIGGSPAAKKMALGTNTIDRLRREVRVIDGYPSSAAEILSFNQFWIRVVRSGDTFSAFASTDGVFWQPYLSQVIIMGDCIRAGLYTYSEKVGNPVTATFTDVSITGLASLANLGAPIAIGVQGLSEGLSLESEKGLRIYPNPTNGELNVNLSSFFGAAVDIRIFNALGQIVQREQLEEVQVAVERFDVSRLKGGMYSVVVKVGETIWTERVVVARP